MHRRPRHLLKQEKIFPHTITITRRSWAVRTKNIKVRYHKHYSGIAADMKGKESVYAM